MIVNVVRALDLARIAPALCLVVVESTSAAEISVEPDGSGDYATIQDAVNAATAGDEIVLEDGTFLGPGNRDLRFFGKDLVVRSRNGAAFVTIDSQGSESEPHRAFRLDAGETSATRLDGITITGGFASGPFPESGGGGILVAFNSHPVIENCVFDGNETGFQGFGAGLLAWEGCDITLRDCTFLNNVSGWYGGGFVLRKECDALVERCQVIGNYALHAGGGASITNSDAIVNDCLFADNETTEVDGGGVLVKAEAMPVFTRCVFAGNRAFLGGALGLGNGPVVTAVDCLFENNEAGAGGAVCADQELSTLHLTRCTFVNNRSSGWGGHLVAGTYSMVVIRNSIFADHCDAATSVYVAWGGSMDVDCSLIVGGQTQITGPGTVAFGASNVDGDPLFCAPDPDSCDSAPLPTADYSISSMSPASPSWNACGRVGAYDVACGATPVPEAPRVPWSRIKAAYR
ncbi:MAG: hypothetical protein DHS20C21_18190 [Gemmatimonadota bacterium]|nr:MAG: hypothetical protein DHS20C21_18190 [Gemmatimonadota bacterium]